MTNPLRVGAERLELIAGEPTAISYVVDGVKYDGAAMDRNKAGAAVQYLKEVAGLDMNGGASRSRGRSKRPWTGKNILLQVTSFGSARGNRFGW